MSPTVEHVKAVNEVWRKFARDERLFMSGYGQTVLENDCHKSESVDEAIYACGFVAGAATCSRMIAQFHTPRWWIARLVGMLADTMADTLRGNKRRTPAEIISSGEQFVREIHAELNKLNKEVA